MRMGWWSGREEEGAGGERGVGGEKSVVGRWRRWWREGWDIEKEVVGWCRGGRW